MMIGGTSDDKRPIVMNLSGRMQTADGALLRRLGKQVTLWAFGCGKDLVDDPQLIASEMESYAERNKMTVKDRCLSKYEPQGVTVVLVLQESHLLVNTWPEHGVMQVEVFSCGSLDMEDLEGIAHRVFLARRTYIFDLQ